MKTKILELAKGSLGAISDLHEQLSVLDGSKPWPSVIHYDNGRPGLNPAYKLRSDWPRVFFQGGFRAEPTFWLRELATGRSVRVAYNPQSKMLNIIDWRLP